jgi:hypothetical protein
MMDFRQALIAGTDGIFRSDSSPVRRVNMTSAGRCSGFRESILIEWIPGIKGQKQGERIPVAIDHVGAAPLDVGHILIEEIAG